ncbi:hypothetical protein [Micromonospora sp. LH3U1]|uniref:hypothetical protein n=1 Tax=Micromonospora sp. LH3U1 TaxID=3018339 RepID=UPI002348F4D5|nr:hypothetical protein [Micromonospora sp. LH3U1]WCN78607.1 hypothetical protein PCA76_16295 [Micromonospora sp. LH3U1]
MTITGALGVAVASPVAAAPSAGTVERLSGATESDMSPQLFCSTKFIVDGVRIRAAPNTSSTIRGLGYKGQWFDIDKFNNSALSWAYGTNRSTGVKGWVSNTSGFLDVRLCP